MFFAVSSLRWSCAGIGFAAIACLVYSPTLSAQQGPFADERYAEEEPYSSGSYASDVAEMFASRFGGAPAPEFPGYERGPDASFDERLSAFGKALAEDAHFRTVGAFDAALRRLVPQKIIDRDHRIVAAPENAAPSKGVCQITSSFRVGDRTVFRSGTAFFVGPRLLVTCAHMVYAKDLGGGALEIEVSPARSNRRQPFGMQEAATYYYPTAYKADETNGDYDFAWLVMPDRTLYRRVQFRFQTKSLTDSQLRSADFVSLGYSIADLTNDRYRMFRDAEQKNQQVFAMRFVHYHDAGPGSSGMPLFRKLRGQYYVSGVHRTDAQGKSNQAVRMVQGYVDQTNTLNAQFP